MRVEKVVPSAVNIFEKVGAMGRDETLNLVCDVVQGGLIGGADVSVEEEGGADKRIDNSDFGKDGWVYAVPETEFEWESF